EHLQTYDVGIDGLRSGMRLLLGERHYGRAKDSRRVRFGRVEIVIEIENVRDRAVHQRRPRHREPGFLAENGARASAPGGDRVENLSGDRLERAGDHYRDRIDKFAMGPIQRILGPTVAPLSDPRTVDVKRVPVHSITLISS